MKGYTVLRSAALVALAALLATVVVTSCGGKATPVPQATPTQQKLLKIGVIQTLSGAGGVYGKPAVDALTVTADRINKAGGVLGARIEMDIEDDASDKTQTIALIRKMAGDPNVVAIIGPGYTLDFLAGSSVAAEVGIPWISTYSVSPWSGEFNKWTFRPTTNLLKVRDQFRKDVVNYLKPKNLVYLYQTEDPTYAYFAKTDPDFYRNLGLNVPEPQTLKLGATDFSTQVTDALKNNPDAIDFSVRTTEYALFARQIVDRGYKGNFITTSWTAMDPSLIDLSGGALKGKMYFPVSYDPNNLSEEDKAWIADYEAKAGANIRQEAIFAHDALAVLVEAVKRANTITDRNAVRAALGSTKDFRGTQGLISFPDGGGDNLYDVYYTLRLVDKGKYELISGVKR